MNEDHAAACHAMVLSALPRREMGKVLNAKMTSVSMSEYSLSFVLCNRGACAMKNIMIPFNPPLSSSDQVGSRLVDDSRRSMSPKFSWLVTDPFMRMIFGVCILLGMGTALGREEVASIVDRTTFVKSMVAYTFGSSSLFAGTVIGAGYLFFIAHLLEAIYTAYLCNTLLQLKHGATIKWFMMSTCVGFPIMNMVRYLAAVDSAVRSKIKK